MHSLPNTMMLPQKQLRQLRCNTNHQLFTHCSMRDRVMTTKSEKPLSDPQQGDTKEWKSSFEWESELRRRQRLAKHSNRKASKFVDQIKVIVRAGKGGDGGVAFHREKFVARGGPSGGNGGLGGCVYFRPTAEVQSLNRVSKILRAEPGQNGGGEWMNGQGGKDLIVDVPIGTVVREIRSSSTPDTPHFSSSRPPKPIDLVGEDEVAKLRRSKLFVHYPESEDSNQNNQVLKQLEMTLLQEQWEMDKARMKSKPIEIDCAKFHEENRGAETKAKKITQDCILIAKGGEGGLGNSNFNGNQTILPRFATRGKRGEEFLLDLELKTLADIGLVGFPNSGKSTLIHALTNSRAEVAPYPFTTLNPQIGTLIIFKDGTWDVDDTTKPIQDSAPPQEYLDPKSAKDLIRDRSHRHHHDENRSELNKLNKIEKMRLTIADCPGLLPKASENFGLGHAFLRHIERSKMLIVVVDLMAGLSSMQPSVPKTDLAVPSPSRSENDSVEDDDGDPLRCCRDVEKLFKELEAYRVGLSNRVAILIANKADLSSSSLNNNHNSKKLEEIAKVRLQALKDFVDSYQYSFQKDENGNRGELGHRPISVVPVSAKFRLNIKKLVHLICNFFSS